MVVMILENVSPSLRGELSRWMLELKAGVFVGKLSALVRDKLWEKCITKCTKGGIYQVYKMNNEQGFEIRLYGDCSRSVLDFDGLKLILNKHTKKVKK